MGKEGEARIGAKVGLYKCSGYDSKRLEEILEDALAANPEWLKGIGRGTRIFLKLNLLKKNKPEEAVTTHPALAEAVTRILQRRGALVTLGDSPGGPYHPSLLKSVYRGCGIAEVAERTGAVLNYDTGERVVPFAGGKVSKSFSLISAAVDADFVISLPKLKTHQMTRYTGAVKNLFGVIPGLRKAEFHVNMTRVQDFSEMLVDLNLCLRPALHIMDAVVGMEGHGPSAGKPRQVGAVLVSQDPFALDVVALTLVGIAPQTVPTVTAAAARGLTSDLADIEISGHNLQEWQLRPFEAPRISGAIRFHIPEFISASLRPRPVFQPDICVGCGVCVENCPPKALALQGGCPQVDLQACIRCFCCQELCPQKAVTVKRNPLARLLEY